MLEVPRTPLQPGRDASFSFDLPAGAAQGPTYWYVLKLRARITWSAEPRATGGFTAATNGKAVSQVEMETDATGHRVFYNGLLTGPVNDRSSDPSTTVEYENYGQLEGIKPGTNQLTFKHQRYEGVVASAIEILPGTVLYRTDVHPFQLEIGLPKAVLAVRAGRDFEVPVKLRHRGQRPEEPLVLTATTRDGDLMALQGSGVRIPAVGDGTTINLRFRATQAGDYSAVISAVGSRDRANGVLRVSAEKPPQNANRLPIAAALTLLAAGIGLARHRHRRTGSLWGGWRQAGQR